jgi:hypothetical protein
LETVEGASASTSTRRHTHSSPPRSIIRALTLWPSDSAFVTRRAALIASFRMPISSFRYVTKLALIWKPVKLDLAPASGSGLN